MSSRIAVLFFTVVSICTPVLSEAEQSANTPTRETIQLSSGVTLVLVPAPQVADIHNDSSIESPKRFYIGITEVTQGQYVAVMSERFPYCKFVGDDLPVDGISLQAAREFCRVLSEKSGFSVRLPTEREWEWVATSETVSAPNSTENPLTGWFAENSGGTTQNVASFPPNQLGIHDLAGNVAEWCDEVDSESGPTLMLPGDVIPGVDKFTGAVRGGSWLDKRHTNPAGTRKLVMRRFGFAGAGFRIVLDPVPKASLSDHIP